MMHKKDARATIQARFDAVTDDEYRTLSKKVQENITKLMSGLVSNQHLTVLSYHANPPWREVSLEVLEVKYPNCTFEHVLLAKDAPLPLGKYAIIFVPLYGYTASGYRLGHGAGWYDRLLLQQPEALKIGVGTRCGLIDFVTNSHDIPMDIIVTDERVTTFKEIDIPNK